MTTLTTTISQKPLKKITEGGGYKQHQANCPKACGFSVDVEYCPDTYPAYRVDTADGDLTERKNLAACQAVASEWLADHLAGCEAPPPKLPKVSDKGDCRFYEWQCEGCQTEWQGSYYNPEDYDPDITEPYTLRQDGNDCGSFSYETAAGMHADFRQAVADHDCAALAKQLEDYQASQLAAQTC